jgi:hypothetical protein
MDGAYRKWRCEQSRDREEAETTEHMSAHEQNPSLTVGARLNGLRSATGR